MNTITSPFHTRLSETRLQCTLCPRNCSLTDGQKGRCGTRVNSGGVLEVLTHGRLAAVAVDPAQIVDARGMKQVTDTGAIEAVVDEVIANNPEQVEQFRAGKDKVLGFFVGQVMRETKGKADPKIVNQLLRKKLS